MNPPKSLVATTIPEGSDTNLHTNEPQAVGLGFVLLLPRLDSNQ